jgi:hypothetical protein
LGENLATRLTPLLNMMMMMMIILLLALSNGKIILKKLKHWNRKDKANISVTHKNYDTKWYLNFGCLTSFYLLSEKFRCMDKDLVSFVLV